MEVVPVETSPIQLAQAYDLLGREPVLPVCQPAYTPAALLALLLLRERLRPTYRGLEDLFRLSDQLRRVFDLRFVLDHAMVWRFARHHVSPYLLDADLCETVRRAHRDIECASQIALDSLASSSRIRAAISNGAKRHRGQRDWRK